MVDGGIWVITCRSENGARKQQQKQNGATAELGDGSGNGCEEKLHSLLLIMLWAVVDIRTEKEKDEKRQWQWMVVAFFLTW